jgi:uncharacterized protein DUF4266
VPASPSFTELLAIVLLCLCAGCATVAPEEKERLADPSMTFTSGGMAERHEEHVLENREGSYGAGNARGGGCGCN